jgi:predicted PurR-regulated permease PerM
LEYLAKFNIDGDSIKQKILKNIDFSSLFGNITGAITAILGNASLIILYILFILLEYRFFKEKIELMSDNIIKRARINSIISKIKNDVKAYFMIKTITSFFTGFLTYFTLISFNVDFALFWSFSIFILNFVPTIGSII